MAPEEEVLKVLYLLNEQGRFDHRNVRKAELIDIVACYVRRYWDMAHFPVVTTLKKRVEKLIKEYIDTQKYTKPGKETYS